METALGGLGVEAIVVGGCCELNTTAHGLIIDIGTQLGIRAATASGEDVNQCVALETTARADPLHAFVVTCTTSRWMRWSTVRSSPRGK